MLDAMNDIVVLADIMIKFHLFNIEDMVRCC